MVGDFVLGVEAKSNNDKENLLIQFWEASSVKMTEDGQIYQELKTQIKPFYIIQDGGKDGALWSYRKQSECLTITIQDDDGDKHKVLRGDWLQIVISSVFRNKMPKNCYKDEKYSLCIPVYKTAADSYYSGSPYGVMEYVFTCMEYHEKFRLYLGLTYFVQRKQMYMYGNHLYGFGRLNILEHAILEMDQLLTVVCQKFPLPLAQYWVTPHPHTEPLRVMYQQSHTEMKNLNYLDKFKQACMGMRLNIDDEGLVGTAYRSHRTFFCNDIKELSMTNQRLAQYASYNMSIPCFIICLKGIFPESRDCVLEFFLPPQEMITNYDQQNLLNYNLLNYLLATMKDHLPSFVIASGERLGQVLMVEVINSSIHNEPRFLKLGELNSYLPHLWKSLFEEDEHIVDIRSTTNSCNETATGETSERAPACHNIAETIHLDTLEEESSIKCIEPQSLTSKSERSKENLINEGSTEEIYHSALETILEVAINHKEHTVAADTDIGHNMDVHTSKREIKPPEDISFESLREHFGRSLDDAAASFGVSRSTFKRICRVHGIKRWPNGKRTMSDNISSNLKRKLNDEEPSRRNFSRSGMPSSQDVHTSQHLNKMTVKANYNRVTIMFELSDLSGIAELEDNVIERLHLEKKSFSIHYQDGVDDWILIACDKDVQKCMEISRSSKKTTIRMKIDEPINNHHAP